MSEEKQGIPEISLFEICYSSFFRARKKAEENAPAKPWSPRGEGLGNNPNIPDNTYLTVSLQPRELPSRSDRNSTFLLPSPFPLPPPSPCLPRPISPVPACSPENHVVVLRGYIQGGGCFQALRPTSAAHVGASASFSLYIACTHASRFITLPRGYCLSA